MEPGAYADEMARFLRMSDEDVERLFRGLPPEGAEDLGDLASFLVDARESLSRSPRSEVEARHLAALAEAIRSRAEDPRVSRLPTSVRVSAARAAERRGPMRYRTVRWAAKVAAAAASVVLLTGGLAFAGVNLPGTAAETAFQKVLGVTLPNQEREEAAEAVDPAKLPPEASETARRVLAVIHAWYAGEDWTSCEFGARVSHAARGLEGEPDTSHCVAAGSEETDAEGTDEAEVEGTAEQGLGKADEASGGASSQGAANGQAGLEVAEQASGGAAGSRGGEDGASDAEEGEPGEAPADRGAEAAAAGRDRAP